LIHVEEMSFIVLKNSQGFEKKANIKIVQLYNKIVLISSGSTLYVCNQ